MYGHHFPFIYRHVVTLSSIVDISFHSLPCLLNHFLLRALSTFPHPATVTISAFYLSLQSFISLPSTPSLSLKPFLSPLAMASLLCFCILFPCFLSVSHAYTFYAGGKDGWVLNPSESYENWSHRNRFQVNDVLGEFSLSLINLFCSVLLCFWLISGFCSVFGLVQSFALFFVDFKLGV